VATDRKPATTSLLGVSLCPVELAPEAKQVVDENVRKAREALAKAPDSADVVLWLGRQLAVAGHVREAIDMYHRGYKPELVRSAADVGPESR
jgi:hypothetical protein